MFELMVIIFVLGYAAIAFEHPIKVDKAASALLIGVLTWKIYMIGAANILPGTHFYMDYLPVVWEVPQSVKICYPNMNLYLL